jgi:Tol biopolymer transport system component
VSVASDGTQGNDPSSSPASSSDGRVVAFDSIATNLVAGDTNAEIDIFVRDRQTAQTTRVSVASDGAQANDLSVLPAVSGDGRYVAFESDATNLVPGDSNGRRDIFVRDRQTAQTTRVSVASDGTQGSSDFGFSQGADASISADGRFVAFQAGFTNLVPGDTNSCVSLPNLPPGECPDIFVHDRQTGQTTRVSVASDGTQANDQSFRPAISADGRYVTFASVASNLVPGDTNGAQGVFLGTDVFVHDRQTGQTTRVSVASDGTQANRESFAPTVSADGRYVAFLSLASNLVPRDNNGRRNPLLGQDVFVHDRQTGQTTRVSVASDHRQALGPSFDPSISADGRRVAFASDASNLVLMDSNKLGDVFVRDRQAGTTVRASLASDGTQANDSSSLPAISADGAAVAFFSSATNLVAGDANQTGDVFVRELAP